MNTPKETWESRWKAFLFENSICDGSCSNPDCGGKRFPEILAFIAQELELAKREGAREVIEWVEERLDALKEDFGLATLKGKEVK